MCAKPQPGTSIRRAMNLNSAVSGRLATSRSNPVFSGVIGLP
ncbi:MAG: hypothetical protein ACI87T_002379, partial [Planctomycetota bacterium]